MITIVQAVLMCFLVAALVRAPAERTGPYTALGYLIVIAVLTYVLVTGAFK